MIAITPIHRSSICGRERDPVNAELPCRDQEFNRLALNKIVSSSKLTLA